MGTLQGSVLIVRHGPGRGRLPGYLDQVFAAIARDDPALARRVRHHHTGRPTPSLDDVRAVVFWLADPLREWYPDCYDAAVRIANDARAREIRIVNAPEALSHSIKSEQERRWRAAGIPTPRLGRFETRAELEALLAPPLLPGLLRGDESHGQDRMRVLRHAGQLRRLPDTALALPGALSEFVDTRRGWPRGTPWARLYHKKRILVMGDVVRTVHVFFSAHPIVSMRSSTFEYQARPLRHALGYLWRLPLHRACLQADYDYWARETEHVDLMTRAARALDLDYVAIDYSDRADAGPILWEANPYFSLPPWHGCVFPRGRRLEERHHGLHAAFAAFLRGLLN